MESTDSQHNFIEKYINEKKEVYNTLIDFLDNSVDDKSICKLLTKVINNESKHDQINEVLQMINSISYNHHRGTNFNQKVNQILLYLKDEINQTLSNLEIFNIFRNNKIILYFLFKNKIITVSEQIYKEILIYKFGNTAKYRHFFYPEFKEFFDEEERIEIEKEILSEDPHIFDNYDEKREEGENHFYICQLIRQDSIEEFVSYVNRANYPLLSKIKPSIFETNPYLIENEPTLIEYSAFFGSIQVYQYLKMNDVELTPSLWIYTIHSQNAELIHLLETDEIDPPDYNFDQCFIESIKCNHNHLASYFESNYDVEVDEYDEINSIILDSHNYEYFPNEFKEWHGFYYLCINNYYTLVNLLLKNSKNEIEEKIILQNHFFFYQILYQI